MLKRMWNQLYLSYIAVGNVKWYSHSSKQLAVSYEDTFTIKPNNYSPWYLPQRNENYVMQKPALIFTAALFVAKNLKQHKYPLMGE